MCCCWPMSNPEFLKISGSSSFHQVALKIVIIPRGMICNHNCFSLQWSKNSENLKLSYWELHYLFLSLAPSKYALCENVLANIENWKSIINSTLFKNAYLFLPSYVDVKYNQGQIFLNLSSTYRLSNDIPF